MKKRLLGLTELEIEQVLASYNQPRYRAKQVTEWIYQHAVTSIDAMTNLPAALRDQLNHDYETGRSAPINCVQSRDGTKKYLFQVPDQRAIETAMIPATNERKTLCISTQVGCKRACSFCATGQQGFAGQLTAEEILNQYFSCEERDDITNIVYMGMGEPFDNYEAVRRSIDIFTAKYGLAKSPARITVSTVGIIPTMIEYLDHYASHLAISLHSPYHEERLSMMPVEKQYPIKQVIATLKQYSFSGQQRLTFEYAMVHGHNDSKQHALDTVQLLKGLQCRVNLIPCNAIHSGENTASALDVMERFQNTLKAHGLTTTIRKSKGSDINAACGMLSTIQGKANSIG